MLALIASSITLNAQSFNKTFTLGSVGDNEYGNAAIELSNGNMLIGINNSILCIAPNGDSLWSKKYTTYGDIAKLFRDQDQKLMMATTSGKMLFANINETNGEVISSFYAPKQFSNSGYIIYDVEVLPSGDYIISYNNGGGNAAIIRYFTPQATDFVWSNDYAGQGYSPKSILIDDTCVVLAGYKDARTWGKDFQVMKLTTSGTFIWKRDYYRNSTGYERLVGLEKNSKGQYIAATSMTKGNLLLPAIVVTGNNGDSIAINTIESHEGKTMNHGMLYSLTALDNGFYAAGFMNINATAPDDSKQGVGYMSAFTISDNGQFTGSATYNKLGIYEYYTNSYDGSDAWGNGCIKTSDGYYLLFGVGSAMKNTTSTTWKGYVVKSNQFVTNSTDIQEKGMIVNELLIYPNPSSNLITIDVLDNAEKGVIVVYNSLGEMVLTTQIESSVNVKLDVSELTSGYYLVQYRNENGHLLGNSKLLLY